MTNTTIYKATDLYELSVRENKPKNYEAFTDNRNLFKVKGKVISTQDQKRDAITDLTKIGAQPNIIAQILNYNYLVYILDIKSNTLIDGSFIVGTNKETLENFHQRAESSKFKKLFENNSNNPKINTKEDFGFENTKETSFDDFDKNSTRKSNTSSVKESVSKSSYTIDDLKGNLENSKKYLNEMNSVSVSKRIQEMDKVSVAMNTYEEKLDEAQRTNNIDTNLLTDILDLDFGGAITLQERALEILSTSKAV